MLYRPLRPGVLLSAAVALGLAGCGAVPWSTQLKLRSFDPLTFDPAVPRAAVMISDRLRVPPGQARIHLTTWHKNTPAQKTTETFTLQEVSEPAPDTLVAARNDDERIAVFRLIPADVPRARALQAQFAARNAAEPNAHSAEFKTDIAACHTMPLPAGPVRGTLYLKLDTATGYLPFFQGLDIRDMAKSAGKSLDDEVRPCPPPSKRQAG